VDAGGKHSILLLWGKCTIKGTVINITVYKLIQCLSHPVTNPLPRTHASRMSDVSSLVTPHVDKDTLYPTSCRTHVL
jgi:hypothetical protein